jgi:hypothetical protein
MTSNPKYYHHKNLLHIKGNNNQNARMKKQSTAHGMGENLNELFIGEGLTSRIYQEFINI